MRERSSLILERVSAWGRLMTAGGKLDEEQDEEMEYRLT